MTNQNEMNQSATNEEIGELEIIRVLNAPRDLVFKVWSEVEHLKNWWGPAGFEWSHADLDFRPGGKFHYHMRSPQGFDMWGLFVYQEIDAPEKIIFVNSFSDQDGNVVRAPFSATFPLEVRNVITFTEVNGKTKVALRGGPINATVEELAFYKGMIDNMKQGFGGTFEQLEQYLEKL